MHKLSAIPQYSVKSFLDLTINFHVQWTHWKWMQFNYLSQLPAIYGNHVAVSPSNAAAIINILGIGTRQEHKISPFLVSLEQGLRENY